MVCLCVCVWGVCVCVCVHCLQMLLAHVWCVGSASQKPVGRGSQEGARQELCFALQGGWATTSGLPECSAPFQGSDCPKSKGWPCVVLCFNWAMSKSSPINLQGKYWAKNISEAFGKVRAESNATVSLSNFLLTSCPFTECQWNLEVLFWVWKRLHNF